MLNHDVAERRLPKQFHECSTRSTAFDAAILIDRKNDDFLPAMDRDALGTVRPRLPYELTKTRLRVLESPSGTIFPGFGHSDQYTSSRRGKKSAAESAALHRVCDWVLLRFFDDDADVLASGLAGHVEELHGRVVVDVARS